MPSTYFVVDLFRICGDLCGFIGGFGRFHLDESGEFIKIKGKGILIKEKGCLDKKTICLEMAEFRTILELNFQFSKHLNKVDRPNIKSRTSVWKFYIFF